ncbi:hypothetical protein JCM3774_004896, partial [Rhodotorula dairenensis]
LRNREKLAEYNSPQDVVDLLRTKKRILILTGAGVSTSCGIPDFRSPTGLYARLKLDPKFAPLDDPQDMFDLQFFRSDPTVFYSFAREIYPSNFVPSACHRFVRLLELEGKLLRNYTQNIDGLFEQVGVERMLNCHGSFATASCLMCRRRFPGSFIEADVFASRVPLCPYCTPQLEALERERERERNSTKSKRRKVKEGEWDQWDDRAGDDDDDDDEADEKSEWEGKAVIKPDIVFFGEPLSDEFDHRLVEDREEVDLLIVMGTSLRVSPVAQLPSHLPHSVPQILINRDPVGHHNFDVCLLGDGDTIVRWLCDELAKPSPPQSVNGEPGPSSSGDAGEDVEEGDEDEKDEDEATLRRTWRLDERVPVQLPTHAVAQPFADSSIVAPTPVTAVSDLAAAAAARTHVEPEQVGRSHVWLFPGANRDSRWVESVRLAYASTASPPSSTSGDDDNDEGTGQGPVELPASLAPGVVEGEGSDGPDDDDDDETTSGSGSATPAYIPAIAPVPDIATEQGTTTAAAADAANAGALQVTSQSEELERIAPSFLHPAADLGA